MRVVAAMERASIRATPAIWPFPGLEPSRLGKFRVVWRMDREPLAGTSPAPKQGPQKAVRMVAPQAIKSASAPFFISAIIVGWLLGYTLRAYSSFPAE